MTEPSFDSPRRALTFALNYELKMPRPAMTKMMADGKVQRIELADGSKITVAVGYNSSRRRPEGLTGLDGAATAGFVLQVLASLPVQQQLVLIAECMRPTTPCSCGSPCCSGERRNSGWITAVRCICDHLRDEAHLSRLPGKKGMSTLPDLRFMLVEKFFVPGREFTYASVAKRFNISEQTVFNHRKPVLAYLTQQQRTAWRAIDEALGFAGIVGDPG